MSSAWYGSFTNRLLERQRNPAPEVGMFCTEICYTDRNPFEVIEIKDARHIVVRELKSIRLDDNGMSACQDYEYKRDKDGRTCNLFLTLKGEWREKYADMTLGDRFILGFAEKYFDYSF